MAMLFASAAALDHASMVHGHAVSDAAAAIREATLGAAADGIRTFDLGGDTSTSGVVDEVIRRCGGVKHLTPDLPGALRPPRDGCGREHVRW